MRVATTGAELAAPRATRAVVMTMGALHEGHRALMTAARDAVGGDGEVVATIFVNPTQFMEGEDFGRYPRTPDADLAVCEAAGVDVVLMPDATEVYGPSAGFRADSITVDPGPRGDLLEGAVRPGHFRGVLTVVHKLLHLTRADRAMFGEKDFQQLVLVRAMCVDLSLAVQVVAVPTTRESDGLAMSSRNRYLDADQRNAAAAIPRALAAVSDALAAGAVVAEAVAVGRTVLDDDPAIATDYLVVTGTDLGEPVPGQPGRALVAARVGTTRLIDNVAVVVPA